MSKNVLLALASCAFLLLIIQPAYSQGCVAIRQMGDCNSSSGSAFLNKGQWQIGASYRYFRSYKHFKGDSEQKERVEQGTEVINKVHDFDLGLTYGLSNRFSVSAVLPILSYDRSSLYEHYGNSTTTNPEHKRFNTGSRGIGDVRLAGTYWLFKPETHVKSNIAVGLGIKLPTGDANVQDDFHKRKATDGTDSIVVKAVDQSIQLGDGGFGVSLELQAYTSVFERGVLYFNGFYLSNPRETNNTVSKVLNSKSTLADSLTAFYSVADQFVVRLGLNYALWPTQNLSANLGLRMEGIPAHDLIGGSKGFRRPGYIVSAEPGLSYQRGDVNVSLNVPVALYRNRVKSVSDLADPAGLRHGDAAFADYSINVGVAFRFGGHHSMAPAEQPTTPKWKEAKH